ncbi:putative surface protease GP63 [Trypanosoma cruzi]|nr:putative surface protease GP63 [Trypanosoma cruzi]
MASRSMVRNAGVRGRALSVVMDSTNAAMSAREHHDCDDIGGVELQDDDGDGRTLESHLSQRHARDERMAPIGGAGRGTELTLAASADLGCMRVNWGMAEPTHWCRKSGCRPLLLQRKRSAPSVSEYCYMLCDVGVPVKRCASDRYFRGWYLGRIHEAQPNVRWTVAPSLIPHWMWGMLTLLFGEENVCLRCLGMSPLRGVWTRLPTTRRMRGTRRRDILVLLRMRHCGASACRCV